MQAYSNPARESDPHSLPNIEIFELTASEVVSETGNYEDEICEAMKDRRFKLASMNSRIREAMIDYLIEEHSVKGGWFYHYCLPGCLSDSEAYGPFDTADLALADARSNAIEDEEDE